MATLALIWNRFLGTEVPQEEPARTAAGIFRSRPLPGEEIYLFQKQFDNSQVIRTVDPSERKTCWQAVAGTFVGALLLIALLLPSAYKLWAGYQLAQIDVEFLQLERAKAELISEQARLISPQRLEKLANAQRFIDPELTALGPKAKGSLALSQPAAKTAGATQ